MEPLLIIFVCILAVFAISRLITFAVLKWKILPPRTLSNGKRLHHFVWGNLIIVGVSFLVIGLRVRPDYISPIFYGIGLGLILDEFPHWLGDVKELQRNVVIIPGSVRAIIVVETAILLLILLARLNAF